MSATLQQVEDAVGKVQSLEQSMGYVADRLAENRTDIDKINGVLGQNTAGMAEINTKCIKLEGKIALLAEEIPPIKTSIVNLNAKVAGLSISLPAQAATNMPMPMIDVSNPPDSLPKADRTGNTSSTAALIRQGDYCKANNRSMLFQGGDYLIEAGKIAIPCSWYGIDNPSIFTRSSIPYNIMLSLAGESFYIDITGIEFNQTEDTHKAVGAYPNGCNILHITNTDNCKIKDCRFSAYGMVSILTQPTDGWGENIDILDNQITWKRKGTAYYDSTPIWGDCISGNVIGNKIYTLKRGDNWRGETGIEIHSPNCIVRDNEVYDHINGIIHCGWPTQYAQYDDSYRGYVYIEKNRAIRCSRGISCWGSHLRSGVVTRNMSIEGNYLNLHLEKNGTTYYYPTEGIGFEDGRGGTPAAGDDSFFHNISIRNNNIETTYAAGLNAAGIMNYGPTPRNQRAAINMATNNSCEYIDISENLISYPYTAIQLMAARDRIQNTHKNIRAINNRFIGTAIWQTHNSGGFDALYNLENIYGFYASGNQIIGKPLEVRQDGVNVSNVTIM